MTEDDLSVVSLTVDRERRIRFFSKTGEAITGFAAKEAIGHFCRAVFRTPFCGTESHDSFRDDLHIFFARFI